LSDKEKIAMERSRLENSTVELARAKHKEAKLLKRAASVKEKAFKEHMHAKALIAKLWHKYREEKKATRILKIKMAQAFQADKEKMAMRLKRAAMQEEILQKKITNSVTSPGTREMQEEMHWLTVQHLMAKKTQLAHVLSALKVAVKKENARSKRKIAILMDDLSQTRKERAYLMAQHFRVKATFAAMRTRNANALRRQGNKIRQMSRMLVKEEGRAAHLQKLLAKKQQNHNRWLKALERIRQAVWSIHILHKREDVKAAKVRVAQALRAFGIAKARLVKQIRENKEKVRLENLKRQIGKKMDNTIWIHKVESEKEMKIKDNLAIKREGAKIASNRLRGVKLIQHLKSERVTLSKELKILDKAMAILRRRGRKLIKGLAHQRSLTQGVKNEKAKVTELVDEAKDAAAQQRSKAALLKESLANKVLGERVAKVQAHLGKVRSIAKVQQAKVTAELIKEEAKVKKMKWAYFSLKRAYHLFLRGYSKRRLKLGQKHSAEIMALRKLGKKDWKLLQKNQALALLVKKRREDLAKEVRGDQKQKVQDAAELQSVKKKDAIELAIAKARAKRTFVRLTHLKNEIRKTYQVLLHGKTNRAHWLREIEKLKEQLRLEENIEAKELEKISARTIHFGHVLRQERAKIAKRIRWEKERETREIEDVKAEERKAINHATKHAAQVMKELKQKKTWTLRELQSISLAKRERLRRLKLREANELKHIAAKKRRLKERNEQEARKMAIKLEHLRGAAAHEMHRVKAKDAKVLTANRQLIHVLAHDQKEMLGALKNLRAAELKTIRKMKNRARLEIARFAAHATSLSHQIVLEKATAVRERKKEQVSESAEIKRQSEEEATMLKERATKDKHLAQELRREKTSAAWMLRQQKLLEANTLRKERAKLAKVLRKHVANEMQYSHEIHKLIREGIQREVSLNLEEARLDDRLKAIITKQTELLQPIEAKTRKLTARQAVAMKVYEHVRAQAFHLRTLLYREERVLPQMVWKLMHESIKFREKRKKLKYLSSKVAELQEKVRRNGKKLKHAMVYESSLSQKLTKERLELDEEIKPERASMARYEKKLQGLQREDGKVDRKKVNTLNKLKQVKVMVMALEAKLNKREKRLSETSKQERRLLQEISKVQGRASQILVKVERARRKAIQMETMIKRLKAVEVKLKLSTAQTRDKARKEVEKIKRLSVQIGKESVKVAAVTRKLNYISTVQRVKRIQSENAKLAEQLRRWKLKRAKEHRRDVLIRRKERRESAGKRSAHSNLEKLLTAIRSSQNDLRNRHRVHKNLEREEEHRKMLLHSIAGLRRTVRYLKDQIEKVHELNKRRNRSVDAKLRRAKLAIAAARRHKFHVM